MIITTLRWAIFIVAFVPMLMFLQALLLLFALPIIVGAFFIILVIDKEITEPEEFKYFVGLGIELIFGPAILGVKITQNLLSKE